MATKTDLWSIFYEEYHKSYLQKTWIVYKTTCENWKYLSLNYLQKYIVDISTMPFTNKAIYIIWSYLLRENFISIISPYSTNTNISH